LTASITITGTVDMNTTGTYILTYSVADAAGNEANASRTVTVVDTTNPVLTLLGDANMSQAKNSAWVDPGATASDSLDGNLTKFHHHHRYGGCQHHRSVHLNLFYIRRSQ
jgi:hypothetical protein